MEFSLHPHSILHSASENSSTVTALIIETEISLISPISSADLFISLKGLLVQYNCMIHRVSPSGESPKIRILKFGAFSIISAVTVLHPVPVLSESFPSWSASRDRIRGLTDNTLSLNS